MTVREVPVLVVGAGPAGLAAAITLARRGVEVLVVDRRGERSSHPRATVVSTRSMELLRSWGLEAAVRARAVDVEWLLWECETLAAAGEGRGIEVGYPTRAQAELVSPVAPLCVAQDQLEPILLEHLRGLPAARVELGLEVRALTQDGHGARVAVRDVTTGTVGVVHAAYVVGADGAGSAVRRALGVAQHGPDDLERVATVLFRAPLDALAGPHRYGIYSITGAAGAGTLLPAGQGDRWLYGIGWDRPEPWPREDMERRIAAAAGVPGLVPRIESSGAFRFAAQLADRFRAGRVFLAGDAAHRVTPRGGTGMNMAMLGAHDLAWKLAWVLDGWGDDALLDSYEAERRPIAEHNVARSADPAGSRRRPVDELHADLGGRLGHAWLADGRTSTLDLLGPGLTLLTGPDGEAWERAVAGAPPGGPPVRVRRLDGPAARALGLSAEGALLTRPDGVPQALWSEGPHALPTPAALLRPAA